MFVITFLSLSVQLKRVFHREAVLVEYSELLKTSAEAALTLPNGETLVHIPDDLELLPQHYTVWTFHPLNPWIHRVDGFLHAFAETGLIFHWKEQPR